MRGLLGFVTGVVLVLCGLWFVPQLDLNDWLSIELSGLFTQQKEDMAKQGHVAIASTQESSTSRHIPGREMAGNSMAVVEEGNSDGSDMGWDVSVVSEQDGSGKQQDGQQETNDNPPYLFWRPFHSEISARGFAGWLAGELGTPVLVIQQRDAMYRVALSSSDPLLAQQQLQRLQNRTGLKLFGDP